MKRWTQAVSSINTKADIIQKQIKLHTTEKKPEVDDATIDTETLKRKDFIMRKIKMLGTQRKK